MQSYEQYHGIKLRISVIQQSKLKNINSYVLKIEHLQNAKTDK